MPRGTAPTLCGRMRGGGRRAARVEGQPVPCGPGSGIARVAAATKLQGAACGGGAGQDAASVRHAASAWAGRTPPGTSGFRGHCLERSASAAGPGAGTSSDPRRFRACRVRGPDDVRRRFQSPPRGAAPRAVPARLRHPVPRHRGASRFFGAGGFPPPRAVWRRIPGARLLRAHARPKKGKRCEASISA